VFDLDGTLVDSQLDFAAMRRALRFRDDVDILTEIAAISDAAERSRLENIVHEHERAGAAAAVLFPGVEELFAALAAQRINTAIFTRNSRATTLATLSRLRLDVSLVVAREDAPPKPSPVGLHRILSQWRFTADDVLFIGDFIHDLEAGQRAGVQTLLFAPTPAPFDHQHAHVITRITDILRFLGPEPGQG